MLKYKNFDVSKIVISKPVKNLDTKKYISDIIYDNNTCVLQSPMITLDSKDNITFKLANRGEFFTIFEDLHEKIIQLIYTNSKEFFNGKEYSELELRSRIQKIAVLTGDTNSIVKLNNINVIDKVQVYDAFKEKSELVYPTNGICIIYIKEIEYTGTKVSLNMKITHVKIDYNNNKKKIQKCILEIPELDELEDELDNKIIENELDNKIIENELDNKIIENELEDDLDIITINYDSKDFFDEN